MRIRLSIITILTGILVLSACNPAPTNQGTLSAEVFITPTEEVNLTTATQAFEAQPGALTEEPATQPPTAEPTAAPTETKPALQQDGDKTSTPPPKPTKPRATINPNLWQDMPVIPEISEHSVQIYQRGLEMGNNPQAFSKLGDCGSTPAWFLGDFDLGPEFYDLGPYPELDTVIKIFDGSYGRTSLAARSGFNASSLFVTLWADREYCETNETPLACEYRLHKPSFAFIMLGSNDIYHPDDFEPQMRAIIEYSIETGVVPILSTKADNEEGDHSINLTIARLAQEYDIPLWNYWAAVQDLPNGGLQEDRVHLTWGRNFYNDPTTLQKAWPIRNLTALQILNAVWRKASGQTP